MCPLTPLDNLLKCVYIKISILKGGDFMRRKALKKKSSQRLFTKGAMNINPLNLAPVPQRGGLRL